MNWLNILVQSKGIKAGGIAVGSSGMVALVLGIIDSKDKSVREFVELKNATIMTKIEEVEKRLDSKLDTNNRLLLRIDDRLYRINKASNN